MKTSCCQSLIKSAKKFNMSVFCFGHLYSFFIAGVGVVHTLMIFFCVHKWWSRYNALINKGAALLLFCCWGVANGNWETARLAFFFASPRHFDFLDCDTETSKCSERERETFRRLNSSPRFGWELWEWACTKVNPCTRNLSTVNKLYYFPSHEKASERQACTDSSCGFGGRLAW